MITAVTQAYVFHQLAENVRISRAGAYVSPQTGENVRS
jgi:hypothetical protein